jgi:hypothetical protein
MRGVARAVLFKVKTKRRHNILKGVGEALSEVSRCHDSGRETPRSGLIETNNPSSGSILRRMVANAFAISRMRRKHELRCRRTASRTHSI